MPAYREIESPAGGFVPENEVLWLRYNDTTVLPVVKWCCKDCGKNLTGDYHNGEAHPVRIDGDSKYGYMLDHSACPKRITATLDCLAKGQFTNPTNNKIAEVINLLRDLGVDDNTIYTLVEGI